MDEPFDLSTTPVHLGLGARSEPLPGFSWEPSYFEGYLQRTEPDGDEGRLVTMFTFDRPWPHWEMQPTGSELVVCVSGRARLTQERDGESHTVELGPGQATVNPAGTWHIADPVEETTMLLVTSGRGTQHRPR